MCHVRQGCGVAVCVVRRCGSVCVTTTTARMLPLERKARRNNAAWQVPLLVRVEVVLPRRCGGCPVMQTEEAQQAHVPRAARQQLPTNAGYYPVATATNAEAKRTKFHTPSSCSSATDIHALWFSYELLRNTGEMSVRTEGNIAPASYTRGGRRRRPRHINKGFAQSMFRLTTHWRTVRQAWRAGAEHGRPGVSSVDSMRVVVARYATAGVAGGSKGCVVRCTR